LSDFKKLKILKNLIYSQNLLTSQFLYWYIFSCMWPKFVFLLVEDMSDSQQVNYGTFVTFTRATTNWYFRGGKLM